MNSPERESDELLRPGDVWRLYGVAASTLRRWASTGLIKPAHRTVGGHRRYREFDVRVLLAKLTEAAA